MLFLMVWYLVILFLLQLTVIALLDAGVAIEGLISSPWFAIISQLAMLLLPMAVWILIRGERLHLPVQKLGAKNIVLIIALGLLLQPPMMAIAAVSTLFTTNYVSELMHSFMQYPFLLILLATAVTPAVVEELVFRGYMQQVQTQNSGNFKKIALLNGLFFGIIHLNLNQFAYAFVMGVIFAYMVYYTRSIWAGIVPHFIINASQGLLGRWAFSAQSYVDTAQSDELLAALPISPEALAIIFISVLSLFLMPVIIVLFYEFIKHNHWRNITMQPQNDYQQGYELSTEDTHTHPVDQIPVDQIKSGTDYYAILVVVIFVVIMIFMYFVN